ncbi:MAG: hypothetical protein KQH53_08340 [Desulfarculaceae bacterium]|nr:hypothetical protein [Desulfarculaceae bacterium]
MEFQHLDSLDKDAFLMGALAVKSSLGAVDSLAADLEHTIKRGDDARFTLVQARQELSQLTETEETQ